MTCRALATAPLLLAAACNGDGTPSPPQDASGNATPAAAPVPALIPEPRDPPPAPHGLTPAGALGYQLLLGEGEELGDDEILAAWRLLVRDPAGATARRDLAGR